MKLAHSLLLCLFFSSAAFAGEANDNARRSDFLNRSQAMKRELQVIRSDYDREGGLRFRADEINQHLSAWVKSWGAVTNLMKNPPATSLTDMEKTLGLKINEINDNFQRIDNDTIDLLIELEDREARLYVLGKIDYRIEAYDFGNNGQDTLEKETKELADTLHKQAANLRDLSRDFQASILKLREGFAAQVGAIWAAKGIASIDESTRAVDDLFLSFELLKPLEKRLLTSLGSFQKALSRDRYIRAAENLDKFLDSCGKLQAELQGLPLADVYKAREKERFDKVCTTQKKIQEKIQANYEAGFTSALNKRRSRIENVCGNAAESQKMNCKLYASISGLTGDKLKGLSRDNLKQLEAIYDAVEDNKRRGNIFEGN